MPIFSNVIDPLQQTTLQPNGSDITTNKIDSALRLIRADVPVKVSQLANALHKPNLNHAEHNPIMQTLST